MSHEYFSSQQWPRALFSMKRTLYDFSWIKFNLAVSCAVQVNVNWMHKYMSTKLQFANSKNLKTLACSSMFLNSFFSRKMFKTARKLGKVGNY